MLRNHREVSAGGTLIVSLVLLTAIVCKAAFITDARWYGCLLITLPAILLIALFAGDKKLRIK